MIKKDKNGKRQTEKCKEKGKWRDKTWETM